MALQRNAAESSGPARSQPHHTRTPTIPTHRASPTDRPPMRSHGSSHPPTYKHAPTCSPHAHAHASTNFPTATPSKPLPTTDRKATRGPRAAAAWRRWMVAARRWWIAAAWRRWMVALRRVDGDGGARCGAPTVIGSQRRVCTRARGWPRARAPPLTPAHKAPTHPTSEPCQTGQARFLLPRHHAQADGLRSETTHTRALPPPRPKLHTTTASINNPRPLPPRPGQRCFARNSARASAPLLALTNTA